LEIDAFDGSLNDARGILRVDSATFDSCPYGPDDLVALEADPNQYAWVAREDGDVVGFVSAFPTHSLRADRWEVDELAVDPRAQGRGLGTALVARAVTEGTRRGGCGLAQAVVSTSNPASQRAFARNGFRQAAGVDLLLYEISGRAPRPARDGVPEVRPAREDDASGIATLSGCALSRVLDLLGHADNLYLVVEGGRGVVGYVELLRVRTLQYTGWWVESISAEDGTRDTYAGLLKEVIERAKVDAFLDEVGILVPVRAGALCRACVGEGFRPKGSYWVYGRELTSG